MVVLGSSKFTVGLLKALSGSSELELFAISEFGEFIGSLLSLEEVVVDALNLGIVVLAASLLNGDTVSESVDLISILSLLLSHFAELILKVICILLK